VTKDCVRLADLSDEPYIDRLSCEMREQLAALCASRKVALYASYRTEREDWVQSLVASGVGFAFMPEHSLLLGTTTARPLVEPELRRTISVVRSGNRSKSPAAKLFWLTLLASVGRSRAAST
jgi:DNA-binding transcriptional LysR family regulator